MVKKIKKNKKCEMNNSEHNCSCKHVLHYWHISLPSYIPDWITVVKSSSTLTFALSDSVTNDFRLLPRSPSLLTSNSSLITGEAFPSIWPTCSPSESEHVRADECASLQARMMRQCIYISLVKQEQWHTASTGAWSMQPEHLVFFLFCFFFVNVSSGLICLQIDLLTTHRQADKLAHSQIIKSDKQSYSER